MANKRMFAKEIVLSDAFLDMPISARCLYFTLGMLADDDGFVDSPKSIMRSCGATNDDLNILLAKRYILGFESGVIVIKHWRLNNYLQADRYKPTTYIEEKETLTLDQKGSYIEKDRCIQSVYTDKNSIDIDKNSIDKISKDDICIEPFSKERLNAYSIILNDKTYYTPNEEDINNWKELYPNVDVEQQLRNMNGWCEANTLNRKTKSGVKKFINNWLSKEQNSGKSTYQYTQVKTKSNNTKKSVDDLLDEMGID